MSVLSKELPPGWASRQTLATTYFPATQVKTAVARLNRWIMTDPEFHTELTLHGYRSRMRVFPPRIVKVFRKYMG